MEIVMQTLFTAMQFQCINLKTQYFIGVHFWMKGW